MSVPTYYLDDLDILRRARNSWDSGETDLALRQFQEATEANPKNVRAHLEWATALGNCYRCQEAIELLATVRLMAGKDPAVAAQIAKCYARLFRIPQAIQSLEAVPEASRTPMFNAERAVYYELVGRFSDAEEAINQCIDEAPDQPEPELVLARILSHQGYDQRAQAVLVQLLKSTAAQRQRHPLLIIRTLYQLAVSLDRQGEYENAIEMATQAKQIQKQIPNVEKLARSVTDRNAKTADIYRRLDLSTLQRWNSLPLPPLAGHVQPAHLVGFPRSGTTLLEQSLDAHPELVSSSERLVFASEILPRLMRHAGSTDLYDAFDNLPAEDIGQLRERYLRYMLATHDIDFSPKVHLDKKPGNLAYLFALLRVFPESKFVMAIRDPRDVLVSCFLRYFPLTDLSACFLSWGGIALAYAQIMQIWIYVREILPEDRWIEVRYEDVCDDIVGQTHRVLSFLGLDEHPQIENYLETTKNKHVHSPTFAEVRNPTHRRSVGRWKNYEHHLEPFLNTLQPFVDALDYR